MLLVLNSQSSLYQPSTMKTTTIFTLFTSFTVKITIRFLISKQPVEQEKHGLSPFGHMRHQLQLETNGRTPAATFTH